MTSSLRYNHLLIESFHKQMGLTHCISQVSLQQKVYQQCSEKTTRASRKIPTDPGIYTGTHVKGFPNHKQVELRSQGMGTRAQGVFLDDFSHFHMTVIRPQK